MKSRKKILMLGLLLGAMSLTACNQPSSSNNNGGGANNNNNSQNNSAISENAGGSSEDTAKGPWTVTFDSNGGAESYPSQTVEHKGTVTDPGTPTRTDEKGTYVFNGWRYDGASWSFKNSKVTSDMTLTASWVEKYSVSYQDESGAATGTVSYFDCGAALPKPADPTSAGKNFYGWMNIKNGGQIWNFENAQLNKVMDDVVLKPLFIPAGMNANTFEAELCPDFTDEDWGPKGMPGATYSGGQNGLGLIGKDFYVDGVNQYGTSGRFEIGTSVVAGFAHFLYCKGDTLTWKIVSDVAVDNVVLFMRLSAEYGITNPMTDEVTSWVDDTTFPVKVNGEALKYGKVTLHNVIPMDFIPFQDYFVSASVSLQAGENTIQMVVDNKVTLNGTIASSAPVVDCIKLYSTSNLSWPSAMDPQVNLA